MKTAIIILNYKNYQDTILCIESIYKFTDTSLVTIFVVDNHSGNDSLSHIARHFSLKYLVLDWNEGKINCDILLIQNNTNKGYAHGNNIGLKIAYDLGYKYLMVLNNDILFVENCVEPLKLTLDNLPEALCVGPTLLKGDGKSIDYNCAKRRPTFFDLIRLSYFGRWLKTDNWKRQYYSLWEKKEVCFKADIISGSCMFFDGSKLNEINYFDEGTFLYFEEAIVAEKAAIKGYSMTINTTVKAIHLGAQSTSKQTTSVFTTKCELTSLKYYLSKYRHWGKYKIFFATFSNRLFLNLLIFKSRIR